ncbi:MAG: hypothetical protein JXA93_03610 [Anaerolineae bacterium]|nr:hypothetical protein [Anaerolineae bacterium]
MTTEVTGAPGDGGLPAEARARLIEAHQLAEEGRLGAAADKCRRALELVPSWAEAHTLYGWVLEEMGFEAKAQAAYDRATAPGTVSFGIAQAPDPEAEPGAGTALGEPRDRPVHLLDAAQAAWEAGKPGSALRACASALAADRDWAEAHYLRGQILEELGDREGAQAEYLEASLLELEAEDIPDERRSEGDTFSGLVAIRIFAFPSEAEIARGRLEADGIPAVVTGTDIATAHWMLSNGTGGVKLCVRREDARDALAVLNWDQDVIEPDVHCPACGSGDVRHEKYDMRRVHLAIMLKLPLRVKKERWTCRRCGANWKEEVG